MEKPKGRTRKTIWIDMDNTPHVPFFEPLIENLRARDYGVIVTVRDAYQTCELADFYKLDYHPVGRHYGRRRIMKIAGTCIRSVQLAHVVRKFTPSLAVAHSSRSLTIASAILKIPSLQIIDYEHIAPAGLAKPTWLMMPEVIRSARQPRHNEKMLTYPGLKEDVYVPRFCPDPTIRRRLGISEHDLMVTVRPPASEAHYHQQSSEDLFHATLKFLGGNAEVRTVLLPRNKRQETVIRSAWPELIRSGQIIIPDHVLDGLNLLWFSDLAISGGGTMNREAAALGVPVYSIFRGTIGDVDRYLSKSGRLVLIEDVQDIRSTIRLCRWKRPVTPPKGPNATLSAIVENILSIIEQKSLPEVQSVP